MADKGRWPKTLPCLGWCGKLRLARHAGDRMCHACRERQRRSGDGRVQFRGGPLRDWERTTL